MKGERVMKITNGYMWLACIAIVVTGVLLFNGASFADRNASEQQNKQVNPPTGKLDMIGDIGDYIPGEVDDPVHDPALLRTDDAYYVFSTGILRNVNDPGGIYVRKSEGTLEGPWEAIGEIPVPDWITGYNSEHLWAPQVIEYDNTYYLYYAVSSFGSNRSAIGVLSSQTPHDLNSWVDHGPIVTSEPGVTDYNAIDPHVFEADGSLWIVYGSHFSGIKLQEMNNPTAVSGEVVTLQNRPSVQHNPVEAPTIIEKEGYYYLFTSWDQCCAGTDSTYKIAVGRSESVTGPYVDQQGQPLTNGGGTVILESEGNQIGPGGQDILQVYGHDYLIHHYYDGDADGVIRMQIRTLNWEDHWPTVDR
jgi:arabinan endo-1,5-alpha-L-arabinosidase